MTLNELEKEIGYTFSNQDLLSQALAHKSWAVEQGKGTPDNERLEFLGDAVLELVISDLIFQKYAQKHSEGDMTRMRASLVNESQLASLARKLGIGQCMRLGKGEEKSGGSTKPSLLSDALEAVIGAIYLDGGFDAAFNFISDIFGSLIETAPEALARDYKSRLQELIQGQHHTVPSYQVENITGPDHSREFHVSLSVDGTVLSHGSGRSKKEAEQKAARRALEKLNTDQA